MAAPSRACPGLPAMLLVAALAAVGCRSPRPAAAARADEAGVEDLAIGDDAHILRCKLAAFRGPDAASERARQRAGELCPGGFQVVDTADGSRPTYVRTIRGVQRIGRGDVAIVVQCHAPRTAD